MCNEIYYFCPISKNQPNTSEIGKIKIFRSIRIDKLCDIKNKKYPATLASEIKRFNPIIIHCHNWNTLKVGVFYKKENPDVKLIYESREMFFGWPLNISFMENPIIYCKSLIVHKLKTFNEKKNIEYVDEVITVSNSISNILFKYFKSSKKPIVVRNIPSFQTNVKYDKANLIDIRKKLGVNPNKKILVFIGNNVYLSTLNLEQVIEEISELKNVVMLFICRQNEHFLKFKNFVDKLKVNNILFHDAVEVDEMNIYLSQCDFGLVPTWNKKDLSYWYALDNKLFEYIMADLPILSTQQPEYLNIVENYKVGVCVNPDNKGAYRDGLVHLMSNKKKYLGNFEHAKKVLNWKTESIKLTSLYEGLLSQN